MSSQKRSLPAEFDLFSTEMFQPLVQKVNPCLDVLKRASSCTIQSGHTFAYQVWDHFNLPGHTLSGNMIGHADANIA